MTKFVERGIVAYFDILGYQNFIKGNKIEYCIDVIENIMTKIHEEIKGFFCSCGRRDSIYKVIEDYFNSHLNVMFVSDTIILFFDFDSVDKQDMPDILHQILTYALFFAKKSFEEGFPVRGCIDYGSFYYNNSSNKNIFAGKTIVNCYESANNLNFSGLVLSENAYKYYTTFRKTVIGGLFQRKIIAKYLVDTKSGEKSQYLVDILLDFQKADLQQYIFDKFHCHNKEIKNEVMEKIKNTEKTFRHFMHNHSVLRGS